MEILNQETKAKIRDLVMREREMAISEREWKHRLRGYGYAIMDTEEGRIVTSLLRGARLCSLPGRVLH
ncbi:hypothetical protein [Roseovarius aestuarii]|uniref:Uncharacterized protein n=1 Tax=Roseovarius aestuarii TaxID=475083 RepID=A0A1X7BT39_9RHOB|nr:hypothetical protein [Roseovarius aestuarii]SMC12778.1 hypothetical protein ROA7745_02610 [Roseovarius aestuarii]